MSLIPTFSGTSVVVVSLKILLSAFFSNTGVLSGKIKSGNPRVKVVTFPAGEKESFYQELCAMLPPV